MMLQDQVLQPPPPTPSLFTATADCPDGVTGLSLVQADVGLYVVAAMTPSSPFHRQGVATGMSVVQCNNNPNVLEELEQQQQSFITLVVQRSTTPSCPFVTAVVVKERADTILGIALKTAQLEIVKEHVNGTIRTKETRVKSLEGKVLIHELSRKGLAFHTCLAKGMQLISINNTLCLDAKEASALLKASTGTLTLLARKVQDQPPQATSYWATATVPRGETMGITLVADHNDKIVISQMDPALKDSESNKLQVGMQLYSINNIVPRTVAMAQQLLALSSHQMTTVLARQTCRAVPGTILTATVHKKTLQTRFGVMLGMDYSATGDTVVIQYVREGGILAETSHQTPFAIEPGMILHRVNNASTKGLHNKQVSLDMLQTAPAGRSITFLCEAPNAKGESVVPSTILDELVTVAFCKMEANQPVGFALEKQSNRFVVVQVDTKGLGACYGLKQGMVLWKIDNINLTFDCATADEAMDMILQVPEQQTITLLCQNPTLPQIVIGTVTKATKETPVGILLRYHKDRTAILAMKDASLSKASDMMAGMVVWSVNNIECKDKTPEQVAGVMAEAEGHMTVLTTTYDTKLPLEKYVAVAVSTTDQSVDDIFLYEEGKVWVTEQGVTGIFQGTALRVGMQVLSINNLECEILTPAGIQTLMKTSPVVTILAQTPTLSPGLLITETLDKGDDPSQKLGMRVVQNEKTKRYMVKSLTDGLMASKTKLLPGMEIMMVNNVVCNYKLGSEVVEHLLTKTTGILTLMAGISSKELNINARQFVTATIQPAAEKALGLEICRNAGSGKLVIANVEDDSLAADAKLETGLEIVSINNVHCAKKTALDVTTLLATATYPLVLLLERPKKQQGRLVTGTLVKENASTKIGVTMRFVNGRVLIKVIDEGTIMSETDLGVGMWIKAINNQPCTNLTSHQVGAMLRAEDSVITILAETTDETFEEPEEEEAKDESGDESKTELDNDSTPKEATSETEGKEAIAASDDESNQAEGHSKQTEGSFQVATDTSATAGGGSNQEATAEEAPATTNGGAATSESPDELKEVSLSKSEELENEEC